MLTDNYMTDNYMFTESSKITTSCSLQREHAAYLPPSGIAGTYLGREGQRSSRDLENIPITCVNLLHINPNKSAELLLSSHFQQVRCMPFCCLLFLHFCPA